VGGSTDLNHSAFAREKHIPELHPTCCPADI